ncbi:MAG: serine/threonine protein kinase [Pseudobutyrivibrio sp.]|nr:serine/threonine protein kinase [Pseudobutyrivibrio sp.]
MIPTGIDDEYEVIRILQQTAATAVLLVNYRKIGDLRILKAIHKGHSGSNSILSEAHLLKGFKSPYIPTIYSVGETTEYYFLVEEYVEGLSLREYLLDNKLDENKFYDISIELCKVLEMLHTAGSEAVLYRDLKPEHVMLQSENIKLIDFGISVEKSKAKEAKALGTKSWASPEQLENGILDERSDIYSLGKILEYMQSNSSLKDDYRLKRLIAKAADVDKSKRFKSVCELKEELLKLRGKELLSEKFDEKHLNVNIAIIGADKSVGTTHIAMSLCSYVNKRIDKSYYKDMAGDDTAIRLKENLKNIKIKKGVLYHESFNALMDYGPAVESYDSPFGIYILDYGYTNQMPDADLVIMVVGDKPWQSKALPEWIIDKRVIILGNHIDRINAIQMAKRYRKKVFIYPYEKSVFKISSRAEKIFCELLKNRDGIDFKK